MFHANIYGHIQATGERGNTMKRTKNSSLTPLERKHVDDLIFSFYTDRFEFTEAEKAEFYGIVSDVYKGDYTAYTKLCKLFAPNYF